MINGFENDLWGAFSATGQIGYYMLFRRLRGESEGDGTDPRLE
jgi:hypothetical protein